MNDGDSPNKPILGEIVAENLLSFGPEGLRLDLKPLNVLIGPNGSGKSNLFEVIGLLNAAPTELANPIRTGGGIRNWLWQKQAMNTAMVAAVVNLPERRHPLWHRMYFTELRQRFYVSDEQIDMSSPDPGPDDPDFFYRLHMAGSAMLYAGHDEDLSTYELQEVMADESILSQFSTLEPFGVIAELRNAYRSISLYRDWQFGRTNVLRGTQLTDARRSPLEPDLSNLGVYLNRLRQDPATKATLIDRLSDAYEGLTDFELDFQGGSVQIYFTEGDLAVPASRLSDGSLRYLCLLALLLDPEPPRLIGIEEPELGLHPDLIPKIADLLVDASSRCQVVVTTHSDILVDALTEHPDSIVVCEKHDGRTSMTRLDSSELVRWLEDYRLGQLWTRGELGGVRW